MTNESEFTGILQRSIRATGWRQLLLAALALPTGLLLVSAQSLGIDPSSFENTTTQVLAYGIGAVFILFAAWAFLLAFLLNPRGGRYLLACLDDQPDRILRVTHVLYAGTDQFKVKYRARRSFSLSVRAEDANAFIAHIAQRAPHALA